MGAAELIYQLRSGKNKRWIQGGTVMKHSNAVGWSDFVNHLAGSDRQKMQGHRGARRKHCVQTAALWQKVADAAGVQVGEQPDPAKTATFQGSSVPAIVVADRHEIDRRDTPG